MIPQDFVLVVYIAGLSACELTKYLLICSLVEQERRCRMLRRGAGHTQVYRTPKKNLISVLYTFCAILNKLK